MIENCLVCQKKIHRVSNKDGLKLRRGKRNVTCSRKCARVYHRIFQYIHHKYFRKKK